MALLFLQVQTAHAGWSLPQERAQAPRRVVPLTPGEHVKPQLGRDGALVQEGLRGVVLDLRGASLRGQERGGEPDKARGVGLVLRNCRDVTVLGGTLGGFEVCVLVEDSTDVRIQSSEFEGWYAPRLESPEEAAAAALAPAPAQGPSDAHGMAILVRRSMNVVVRGARGRGGESGVRIESSNGCSVLDSDFSFLARHGISLWDAQGCTLARNRVDYCLREDGRLAAGVVMVQARDNVVAFNRATHCQRGLADVRGSGNLLWRNDVSHAREAGVELVWSTGARVLENVAASSGGNGVRAIGCEDVSIAANQVEDSAASALRLESCRGSFMARNVLHGANIGVHVISLSPQDGSTGPCPQSGDHTLWGNSFARNGLDLMITRSGNVLLQDNVFTKDGSGLFTTNLAGVERLPATREELLARVAGLAGTRPSGNLSSCTLRRQVEEPPPELEALLHPVVPEGLVGSVLPPVRSRAGVDSIFMGPWGPWDYE